MKKTSLKIGDDIYFFAENFDLFYWKILKIDWEKSFVDCENKNIHKKEEYKNFEVKTEELKIRKNNK